MPSNPGIVFDPALLATPLVLGPPPFPPPSDRRSVLQLIVASMDLTSLNSVDTDSTIQALCTKAVEHRVAAVCVYPVFIPVALKALGDSGIPVATVAGGFPHGLSPMRARLIEIEECAAAGASEIDVVISRGRVKDGDYRWTYDEVRAMRDACGPALMKVILGTGELTPDETRKASMAAMMGGADFIKTSTGKEETNATLEAGRVMAGAIREFCKATGLVVGLRPAGGIRNPDQALAWISLVRGELGGEWLRPERFRIGASSLLQEIISELDS